MSLYTLLGYSFTLSMSISLILLIASVYIGRKEIKAELKGISKYSIILFLLILALFLYIAIFHVTAFEELYFDENIYQGIAMNILKHGEMLWCLAGTGYLNSCYISTLYHDPAGWSFFIAIFFAILGISTSTAYISELFIGSLSLLFIFILSYLLSKKNSVAVFSTAILALMPEVLIWSRTQADPDLPFMTFSIMTFMFFVLFMKRKKPITFSMFLFSLSLTLYMRTEAVLLLGIFALLAVLFDIKNIEEIKDKIFGIIRKITNDEKFSSLMLVFFLLMAPQIIYVGIEASNPQYGQPTNAPAISTSYLNSNLNTNINYLLGNYNSTIYFPAVAAKYAIPLAILGSLLILLQKKNRLNTLLLAWSWFFAYLLFYSLFYAGGALFGVDVRFMLQTMPSLAIMDAFGVALAAEYIAMISKWAYRKMAPRKEKRNKRRFSFKLKKVYFAAFVLSSVIIFSIFVAYPFEKISKNIDLNVSDMPQQNVIAPSIQFFYSNYSYVPSKCLVFSFTPDIWYEVGRPSMQIGYMGSSNSTIVNIEKNFTCYVLDYGYWCMVPPYNNTLCAYGKSSYSTITLSEGSIPYTNEHPAFYLLENYTT